MRKDWIRIALIGLVSVAAARTVKAFSHSESGNEASSWKGETRGRIVLVATTSFRDSGLADVLVKEMEKISGYKIDLASKGSGTAIQMLLRGDAQIGITHAPDLEQALVDAGWTRMPFMKNYFCLVGPKDDPAGVKDKSLLEAFQIIHDRQLPFVNRNDNSGTDMKERRIWGSLGLDPNTFGDWYVKTQAGMLTSLLLANEKHAYILTDQSTWMNNKDKLTNLDLITALEEGENIYSFFFREPQYKVLADYLKTPEARGFIKQYYFDTVE
ncbi:hypothetical protein COPRO5265_0076 [Coprothermobacter proteolyticus DSM 5265]|uniref:substrate-binding domain-containing protein n=1 Tax=Coprothermobacter proteolyticus TaxID=35786 RepID=UPI0002F6264E|nr:substrate-binding domain-containing protein [Coprothermobacter proteolyticus]ACI17968.2 hypothetical protein COPRO5265_0076 [Coprothermobacter proteolyticus DSM 5265]